jgi:hypothetical protein
MLVVWGLRFLVVMVRNPSEQLLSDAIKETANSQLVSILMNVTGSLVNVVNSFIAAGQFTFSASNYQNWNSVGSKATDDTIRSLAQLYQRKLQAAPLPLNLLDSKFEDVEDVHWTYPGGEYYKGEAVNNKRHGYGKQHWADGRHYEGNWARNKQEGYGKMVWTDGANYTGEFKADQIHGHGLYIWADGANYNGEWSNGVKHGEGIYIYSNGRTRKGMWKNGKEWNY